LLNYITLGFTSRFYMLAKNGMYYDIAFLGWDVVCYSVQPSSLLWSNWQNFLPRDRIDESMIPFEFDDIITFAFAELLDFVHNKKHFFTCLTITQVCIHKILQKQFHSLKMDESAIPFDFNDFHCCSYRVVGLCLLEQNCLFFTSLTITRVCLDQNFTKLYYKISNIRKSAFWFWPFTLMPLQINGTL